MQSPVGWEIALRYYQASEVTQNWLSNVPTRTCRRPWRPCRRPRLAQQACRQLDCPSVKQTYDGLGLMAPSGACSCRSPWRGAGRGPTQGPKGECFNLFSGWVCLNAKTSPFFVSPLSRLRIHLWGCKRAINRNNPLRSTQWKPGEVARGLHCATRLPWRRLYSLSTPKIPSTF